LRSKKGKVKSKRKGKLGKRKEKQKVLIFALLFVTLAFLSVSVGCASAATTIYVPEGGNQTIQQAVNNATAGDTIIVRDGIYTENINVYKRVTIFSENGSASTIVQAANPDDHVLEITADYVNISGFTATGATGGMKVGIYLNNADHCNISDNNAMKNICGIFLESSSNNNLTGNTVSDSSQHGIRLSSSSNNTLTNNTVNSRIIQAKTPSRATQ
jgi:parallel beta-helix repeat protein